MQRARRRRLLLVLTACLVVLVGIAGGIRAFTRQEKKEKKLNNEVNVKDQELNKIAVERKRAAELLFEITDGKSALDAITDEVKALDPRGAGEDRRCSHRLKSRLERYPRFQDFGVVNAGGEVRCIALFESYATGPKPTFAERIWFQEAMAHPGKEGFGDFQVGRITECPTVTIARTIQGDEPKLVAFASVRLSWLPRSEPASSAHRCDGR
jgi:hypothetical protein